MATVIDALLVTLGLDAKAFETGSAQAQASFGRTKQNAAQAAKEVEASGKRAAEFFTSIKKEALGLFAVFLGGRGLGSFVADTVTSLAALGRASRSIGASVPEIAAVGNAVARIGGNSGEAIASFQSLSDEMERFKVLGSTTLVGPLNQLGLGRGASGTDVLLKLAETADHDIKLARLLGQNMGLSEGVIQEALRGSKQVRADLADAKALGVPTEQMTRDAERLQTAWARFSQAATNVGERIFGRIAPFLTGVLDVMTKLITAVPQLTEAIAALGVAFLTLRTAQIGLALLRFLGGIGAATAGATAAAGAAGVAGAGTGAGAAGAAAGAAGVGALGAGAAGARAAASAAGASVARGFLGGLLGGIARFAGPIGAFLYAMKPSAGAGAEELEFERRHREEYARSGGGQPGGAAGGRTSPAIPPSGLDVTSRQYGAFKSSVAGIEHARYDQMGGSSGRFAGRYQMGAAEIAETAKRLGVAAPSQAQFLADPAMQERFFDAYTAGHHQTMMAGSAAYRALPADKQLAALAYAHNQGAGGAMRWLATGAVGRDAFGTAGTTYANAVDRSLAGAADPAMIAAARPAAPAAPPANIDRSSEVHIASISIHTQAKDADGIARSIDPALRRRGLVVQANTGLS